MPSIYRNCNMANLKDSKIKLSVRQLKWLFSSLFLSYSRGERHILSSVKKNYWLGLEWSFVSFLDSVGKEFAFLLTIPFSYYFARRPSSPFTLLAFRFVFLSRSSESSRTGRFPPFRARTAFRRLEFSFPTATDPRSSFLLESGSKILGLRVQTDKLICISLSLTTCIDDAMATGIRLLRKWK